MRPLVLCGDDGRSEYSCHHPSSSRGCRTRRLRANKEATENRSLVLLGRFGLSSRQYRVASPAPIGAKRLKSTSRIYSVTQLIPNYLATGKLPSNHYLYITLLYLCDRVGKLGY
ncbi:jg12471 [Pararge aegeria aegeria]|uniref:Jg12471 protein n=1 Tax=Pararge aegeria aegeria TaxID=348720 RepID=A0A8S4RQJ2_9NEOP|nr:jg12471 [Pararge aegeria aegeria]